MSVQNELSLQGSWAQPSRQGVEFGHPKGAQRGANATVRLKELPEMIRASDRMPPGLPPFRVFLSTAKWKDTPG